MTKSCTDEDVSNIGLNKIQTHFVAIINTDIVFFINRSSFGDYGYFIQSQSELNSALEVLTTMGYINLHLTFDVSVRNLIQINLTRFRVLTAVR